jgi:hypothetical protein
MEGEKEGEEDRTPFIQAYNLFTELYILIYKSCVCPTVTEKETYVYIVGKGYF